MFTGASWQGVDALRILWNVNFRLNYNIDPVEACVCVWLTAQTPDLESGVQALPLMLFP